jgi:hypothetical protein
MFSSLTSKGLGSMLLILTLNLYYIPKVLWWQLFRTVFPDVFDLAPLRLYFF